MSAGGRPPYPASSLETCVREMRSRASTALRGGRANGAVAGNIDGCATLAEDDDRTEDGIGCHAEDELMSVRPPYHGLHGEARRALHRADTAASAPAIALAAASTAAGISRSRTTPPTSDLRTTSDERILSATGKPMARATADASPAVAAMRVSTTGTLYAASTALASGSERRVRPSARAPVTTACALSRSWTNSAERDGGTSINSS